MADGGDDDRGSHAARRADGAEDANGIMAVVAQHGWTRANGRRDIFDRPFLADTGFVWNQTSITLSRTVCRQGIQSQAAEAFLKASWAAASFGVRGPRLKPRQLQLAKPPANGAFRWFSRKPAASLSLDVLPAWVTDKPIEVWFQDDARVGQKGSIEEVWAPIGSGPPMVRDNRHDSVHIFGAICPRVNIIRSLSSMQDL